MLKRTFDRQFKRDLCRQLVTGEKRLAQVCREHNLSDTLVRKWRDQYERLGAQAWLEPTPGRTEAEDAAHRIAALEAALGRATLENDFLRHTLALLRKRGSVPRSNGK
jgi:transposase-like protein